MKSYKVSQNDNMYYINFDNNYEIDDSKSGIIIELWFKRDEWNGEQGNDDNKWCYINKYYLLDKKGYLALLFNRRPAEICREYLKKLGFKILSAGMNTHPFNYCSNVKPNIDWTKILNCYKQEEEN